MPRSRYSKRPRSQPLCGRGDNHGARLGHSLEASRQVRRFAYDGLLLSGTLAYKVTHHDQPGRNPDPDLQRHAGGRVEFRYGFDQSKSSLYGAFGVMLVSVRIAEIGEHAVAHVLGDKTALLLD